MSTVTAVDARQSAVFKMVMVDGGEDRCCQDNGPSRPSEDFVRKNFETLLVPETLCALPQ